MVVINLIFQVRAFSSHIRKSPHLREALKHVQKLSTNPQVSPMIDEPTRWSSTFYMLCRFSEIFPDLLLLAAMGHFDNFEEAVFPLEKKDEIDMIIKCLEPMEEFIRLLEGEKYVTISIVVPLYSKCVEHLHQLSRYDLSQKLLSSLDKRLGYLVKRPNYALCATALDPRYPGVSRYCSAEVEEMVWDTLTNWAIAYNALDEEANQQPLHLEFMFPAFRDAQSNLTVRQILEQYKELFKDLTKWPLQNRPADPLDYWKKTFQYCPQAQILKFMLECLFGIPATSAPSERVFSLTGNAMPPLRSRMIPETLEEYIIISEYVRSPFFDMAALLQSVTMNQ